MLAERTISSSSPGYVSRRYRISSRQNFAVLFSNPETIKIKQLRIRTEKISYNVYGESSCHSLPAQKSGICFFSSFKLFIQSSKAISPTSLDAWSRVERKCSFGIPLSKQCTVHSSASRIVNQCRWSKPVDTD